MKKLICSIVTVCSLVAVNAHAENIYSETILRCDNGLVSIGEAEVALYMKCGQPVYQRNATDWYSQVTFVTGGMLRVVDIYSGWVTHIATVGRAN
jgi:hypothetical protein